jgi:hypothetical protein
MLIIAVPYAHCNTSKVLTLGYYLRVGYMVFESTIGKSVLPQRSKFHAVAPTFARHLSRTLKRAGLLSVSEIAPLFADWHGPARKLEHYTLSFAGITTILRPNFTIFNA